MSIKDIWNKFRKGVKTGMMAMKESNVLNDTKVIRMINDFNNSGKRRMMMEGERYYRVDNDIKNRKIVKMIKGSPVEETYKANNKLAHAKYKNMVDEKIAYLLSKDYSLKCEDSEYITKVNNVLGKHFQYQLTELGYESSNKGIAWQYCYINEAGDFKTMVIPSEQLIPVWTDRTHSELEMLIRVYPTSTWEYDTIKSVTNVEVWERDNVSYYRLDGKSLLPTDENYDGDIHVSHFKRDDIWSSWGKVPFVPYKNNHVELSDLTFVKSLVDGYDMSRSEAANYVEEVKNLIFVLKGYGGADLTEFMQNLNENRAIAIDDVEEGGVDTLTPTMDITALREHYEQLKRDIVEDGQSVNKDLDKFGSAPSGVALRFMYSGLDLKSNLMETEFKMGFERTLYFVNEYLGINESVHKADVDLMLNRDMEMNETEVINNCLSSKNVVSDKTILGNHPWVKKIEDEEEALAKQREDTLINFDTIPTKTPKKVADLNGTKE